MLKKSTIAVMTALTTMLSAVSPLATYAEMPEHEHVQTIPDRNITQELTPYSNAPAVLDSEMMPASTTATIPDRVYTCTNVPRIEVQPTEFPLRRTYDVNVNVVDSKTNEHVDGVKVHFVETQSLQSNVITRDYGTWDTSESENYSIDIIHLFNNLSSTITLTAVLEDIPEGYSYLGGTTNVADFIIDNAMDWYYANYYGYEHQPLTDLTIYLDKEYKGSFQAICYLIDGNTGNYVEGAEVSLREWDENGNLGNCVEWVTTGQEERVDFDYTIPGNSTFSTIQFVADKLPEKYNKYTFCPFVENYAGADSNILTFILYLYEDGEDHVIPATTSSATTTALICDSTTTTTSTTTSTTQTTANDETRACDGCGKEINVSDGIITPLGIFLCRECRGFGMGGTTTSTTTHEFFKDVTTTTRKDTTALIVNYGTFTVECAVYDSDTNEIVPDIEMAFVEDNDTEIIDMWTSDNNKHSLDISYSLVGAYEPTSNNYRLIAYNLPDGYVIDETNPETMKELKLTKDTPALDIVDFKVFIRKAETGTATLYGDANCDGKVGISDAVLIMQALSNPNEYKLSAEQADLADVYNRGDGITPQDALTIQEVNTKIISQSDLPLSR